MIRPTAALRGHLSALFKSLGVNAYYFYADDNAKIPYIVYELRHIGGSGDTEDMKRYVMEVDAYTKEGIIALDNLLDDLEAKLSGYLYNGADFFIWIKLAYNRIDLEEPHPLKRKRVTFEVEYSLKGAD